jgi:hypothetical protein
MKRSIKTLAIMAVLLAVTAIPAWASQGVGSSPYAADLLVSGLNTGELDPGAEYWYAYSRLDLGDPDYKAIILSLNFEAEGRAVASRVNFQVFDFVQVDSWLKDSSGPVDSLGLGAPASADFDVNTGERLWAGPVEAKSVYYVRIFNLSPSPVKFRLTALGQKSVYPEAFLAAAPQAVIPASVSLPTGPQISLADTLPAIPTLPVGDSPASTRWLLAVQAISGLPPQEAAAWLMSAAALGWLPAGSGAGALLPVDPNADRAGFTGGGSGDGDGAGQPGDSLEVPAAPNLEGGESVYPNQPLILRAGENIGRMAPGTERWYTFTHTDLDKDLIEGMSLTMFFTPGEPNLARHVTFEMFAGSQYHIWERGTPKAMEHFGVGSWVSRDGDYDTGERLWHGSIVDGDQYYVKITNDTAQWVDYHLLTGDIINIEMGPKPAPSTTVKAIFTGPPTGEDIGSPLPVSVGRKAGQLPAGQDLWFQFDTKTTNPDKVEQQHYVLTLDHTPGAGFVTNYVNVEIYPYPDQHLWQRGTTDQIKPLGAGSDLKYDKATDTHTWVWDGHLISNTSYFVRVRNDSARPINYDLLIEQRRP